MDIPVNLLAVTRLEEKPDLSASAILTSWAG